MKGTISAFLIAMLLLTACSAPKQYKKRKTHTYINPVDTRTKIIEYQKKGSFIFDGVGATNNFSGARLNNFDRINDSTFTATINPENTPINPSPWYAFKIWSKESRTLSVKLQYGDYKHRYNPKISTDGEHWTLLDSSSVQLGINSTSATIQLKTNNDTLWVAAQEIQDSKRVGKWIESFRTNELVTIGNVGKSAHGRPLFHMNITKGSNYKKAYDYCNK